MSKPRPSYSYASRYKTKATSLFHVFCEVLPPGDAVPPSILTKWPESYEDPSVLQNIPRFTFPCPLKSQGRILHRQKFIFNLTDSNSQFMFGYVVYDSSAETAVTLVSDFYYPAAFFSIIDFVSQRIWAGDMTSEAYDVVKRTYASVEQGTGVEFWRTYEKIWRLPQFDRRIELSNPSMVVFLELDDKIIKRIYASILKERRIAFVGRDLEKVSACVQSCAAMLHPMEWQSIYVTMLPLTLSDMVTAPMPYIIGMPTAVYDESPAGRFQDVVLINLDKYEIKDPFHEVKALPSDVQYQLQYQLSAMKSNDTKSDFFGNYFLKITAMIFGEYSSGIVRDSDTNEAKWDVELFVASQPPEYRPYLAEVCGSVQYLERFIASRLEVLNDGQILEDDFEAAIPEGIRLRKYANPKKLESAVQSIKASTNQAIGNIQNRMQQLKIAPRVPKGIIRGNSQPSQQPMAFDNIHWQGEYAYDQAQPPAEQLRGGATTEIPTATLITLATPTEEVPKITNFSPFDSPFSSSFPNQTSFNGMLSQSLQPKDDAGASNSKSGSGIDLLTSSVDVLFQSPVNNIQNIYPNLHSDATPKTIATQVSFPGYAPPNSTQPVISQLPPAHFQPIRPASVPARGEFGNGMEPVIPPRPKPRQIITSQGQQPPTVPPKRPAIPPKTAKISTNWEKFDE